MQESLSNCLHKCPAKKDVHLELQVRKQFGIRLSQLGFFISARYVLVRTRVSSIFRSKQYEVQGVLIPISLVLLLLKIVCRTTNTVNTVINDLGVF